MEANERQVVETSAGPLRLVTAGRGDRPLLVLTPMADWMLAALPAPLGARFTVTLMELPASIDAITAAVTDVAAGLSTPPVLFGHSMNGALALAAATSAPCVGVIAVTPPAALPPDPALPTTYWEERAEPERRRRAKEIVDAHEATTDPEEKARLQTAFTDVRRWYDLDFDPAELDRFAGALDHSWITAVFEDGKHVDWPQTFRQIDQPVLLALGDYDFVAPPSAWADATRLPPHTTVHHFHRSGHTPYYEEPDEFLQVVERWTTDLPD